MLDNKWLEQSLLEMRGRCLKLAADLDRLDKAGAAFDPQLAKLRQALGVLTDQQPERALRVQMIFSDTTAPPPYQKP